MEQLSTLHSSTYVFTVIAWTFMMSAMMLPGYLPWVRIHAEIARREGKNPVASTAILMGGYLTAWIAYSTVAAGAQVALGQHALLNANLQLTGLAAGSLLIAAGIFQFAPLKSACLSKCRNPMSFMLTQSHDGQINSYKLGLKQGIFCVGCCWGLMALGFAVGVLNVWAMVGLTVLVTIEKLAPSGKKIGRAAGVGFVVWGLLLL